MRIFWFEKFCRVCVLLGEKLRANLQCELFLAQKSDMKAISHVCRTFRRLSCRLYMKHTCMRADKTKIRTVTCKLGAVECTVVNYCILIVFCFVGRAFKPLVRACVRMCARARARFKQTECFRAVSNFLNAALRLCCTSHPHAPLRECDTRDPARDLENGISIQRRISAFRETRLHPCGHCRSLS